MWLRSTIKTWWPLDGKCWLPTRQPNSSKCRSWMQSVLPKEVLTSVTWRIRLSARFNQSSKAIESTRASRSRSTRLSSVCGYSSTALLITQSSIARRKKPWRLRSLILEVIRKSDSMSLRRSRRLYWKLTSWMLSSLKQEPSKTLNWIGNWKERRVLVCMVSKNLMMLTMPVSVTRRNVHLSWQKETVPSPW